MGAAVELRHRLEQLRARDVADQEHVEEPVVRLGLRADLHAAAEIAAVRHDHVLHPAAARLAVDRDAHLAVLPAREDGERGPGVGTLAAEPLRRPVAALAVPPPLAAPAAFA